MTKLFNLRLSSMPVGVRWVVIIAALTVVVPFESLASQPKSLASQTMTSYQEAAEFSLQAITAYRMKNDGESQEMVRRKLIDGPERDYRHLSAVITRVYAVEQGAAQKYIHNMIQWSHEKMKRKGRLISPDVETRYEQCLKNNTRRFKFSVSVSNQLKMALHRNILVDMLSSQREELNSHLKIIDIRRGSALDDAMGYFISCYQSVSK